MSTKRINNSYLLAAITVPLLTGVIASTAFSLRADEGSSLLPAPPHQTNPTTAPIAVSRPVAQRRVTAVTTRTFDEQVMKSPAPVLVDFYADWCGPCQIQGRVLNAFVSHLEGAKIVKVNVDRDAQLAQRFAVTALPTLLIVQEGKVIGKQVGLVSEKQLRSVFANYLVENHEHTAVTLPPRS